MACDEDVVPLATRVADVADEFELDEVMATERQLLYAAITRARDRVFISGVAPGSEFLDDLRSET
jgi:superfamily I DNA/RNA helicase